MKDDDFTPEEKKDIERKIKISMIIGALVFLGCLSFLIFEASN